MTDNSKFVQIAAATQGGRTSALYALDSEGIVWMLDDHLDVWRRVSTKRAPVD